MKETKDIPMENDEDNSDLDPKLKTYSSISYRKNLLTFSLFTIIFTMFQPLYDSK